MLTIRLSRTGKKNQPFYRLIISEKTKDPWGKYLELLGNFNPRSKELNAKKDRIKYWLSKGAQMSPTINNLLLKAGIISGKKQKSVNISKTRNAKMSKVKDEAKAKAKADQAKLDETATKSEIVEAAAEKPAAEAPAPETDPKAATAEAETPAEPITVETETGPTEETKTE